MAASPSLKQVDYKALQVSSMYLGKYVCHSSLFFIVPAHQGDQKIIVRVHQHILFCQNILAISLENIIVNLHMAYFNY